MTQALGDPRTASLSAVEGQRRGNLRQLMLRVSRGVNRQVVQGLNARGYGDLRATHTTLLSNMDLAGSTVTVAAERAGISKQAMGRLAADLEAAGYIRIETDPSDNRARILKLTDTGEKLMLDSLEVMSELERRYAAAIGFDRLAATLGGLTALLDEFGVD